MKHNFIESIKIIFSIVFVCISTSFLFGYSILETSEDIFKEENIVNTIKNIDIVELIGEEKKQEIYAILEKAEIPMEYIDAMLEDEELKEQIGKYAVSSMKHLQSLEKMPEVDAEEATNLLTKTFDKVIVEAENHNIEVDTYISKEKQNIIHEKIEYYVPEIIEKIPEIQTAIENKIYGSSEYQKLQSKIKQIEKYMNIINKIYEYKWILLVITIIPLIIIVIMKWKDFKFIKWLALPPIFVVALLKVTTLIIPIAIAEILTNEGEKLKSIISPSIELLLSNMNGLMVIYFEVGLAIILIQIGVTIYKNALKNGE